MNKSAPMANQFSKELNLKINLLKQRSKPILLGQIKASGPLSLAPMSQITQAPFRLLMEELGAGLTVSELISCHGINYNNQRTLEMLTLAPGENNVGLQLFGEDPECLAKAAQIACEFGPKFIDINMGCPVRKVVTKGGGSALLKDLNHLEKVISSVKKAINIPLTIKIRTGWDESQKNAAEVLQLAYDQGVEFVAIHGRTRSQGYSGKADWTYLEDLAKKEILPLIGNGDLYTPDLVKKRLNETSLNSLMIGRGALRNPFIFLESYANDPSELFTSKDYFEVIMRFKELLFKLHSHERRNFIQLRKHIIWFAWGLPGSSLFRDKIYQIPTVEDLLKYCEDFFLTLGNTQKNLNENEGFMQGGHG